jgi:FkbM family methyltransferase
MNPAEAGSHALMPRRRLPRLDALEVVLVVGLAVVITWTAARQHYSVPAEARAFRALYGRSVDSQYDEELFIRDFFNGRRAGFFVDVGANDYRQYNNTYYLEATLGWSGIAVDALGEFAADYERYRPRTRFFTFFVSDVSDTRARFWAARNSLLSSAEQGLAGHDSTARDVPTIRLDDLLAREGVNKVDFLTMDIELAEPKALAGFDLPRFRPDLVCIEAHLPVRQSILDYFTRRGYVVVGRYLRADEHNLYFMPLAR